MEGSFAIASFRSRQQVINFESRLKRAGIRCDVVSTPREIAVGCGLSVRFEYEDIGRVKEICRSSPPQNMIGIYAAVYAPGNRVKTVFTPVMGSRGY